MLRREGKKNWVSLVEGGRLSQYVDELLNKSHFYQG